MPDGALVKPLGLGKSVQVDACYAAVCAVPGRSSQQR
jgi:hypothetical protein